MLTHTFRFQFDAGAEWFSACPDACVRAWPDRPGPSGT